MLQSVSWVDLELRDVSSSDAAACHNLSQQVDWPHCPDDWEMLIGLGRGVIAAVNEKIVASALWWPCGPSYASLGMIIDSPAQQRGEIGERLMAALLRQTRARGLSLNATAAGEPLYRKLGFSVSSEVHQYEGIVRTGADCLLPAGYKLRRGSGDDLPTIAYLDEKATGLSRKHLLKTLLTLGDAVVLERGITPVGYAFMRPFGGGYVVGPVIADRVGTAKLLLDYWLSQHSGELLRVDITTNSELAVWLDEMGLNRVGKAVTMTKGWVPESTGPARVFAISSQALG